ncbi:MAG: bacillithiol biosynthesis deacetylase BshB1 [Rhodothermia bacterium]|nr:bacillithiol biosynthesis deacetylase BshB1 [Rhodothermia bacterium]
MSEPTAVDVLAFGAHPDDVELWCGGTVCTLTRSGYAVGVVDLTQGELGSRGSASLRQQEAEKASRVMSIASRTNLEIPDGDIRNTIENRNRVISAIRASRPRIMLVGAPVCRHPDHAAATELVTNAAFYAGLSKVETRDAGGASQEPFRPDHILHYMQALSFEPTFVVDVSAVWETRMKAIRAYGSQFFNPDYVAREAEPETFVSTDAFLQWIEARARSLGYPIGAAFGEGLLYRNGPVGISDLMTVLARQRPHK